MRAVTLSQAPETFDLLADLFDPKPNTTHPAPFDLANACTYGDELNPPHLELLDRKLVDLAEGRIRRLLVTMPPRHGKSQRCSKWFPSWYLSRFPDRKVILASYGADFAAEWGAEVRAVLTEHDLGVNLRQDSKAKDHWKIQGHEGGMVTAGVGGPITGRGAHLLIIDDPVKNRDEAQSDVYRERTWKWYTATASTRLQRDGETRGGVLLIQTRWHESDLAGRLLEHEGDRWDVLNLPALAEAGDALGREVDEPLWPEMFDASDLAEIRHTLGSYDWTALYQQRPSPAEGAFFKRPFRYWSIQDLPNGKFTYKLGDRYFEPKECWRFITVDLAASVKTSADFTVVATWAVTYDGDLLLLDRSRQRIEEGQHFALLQQHLERWKPQYVGVESRMFGTALVYEMGRRGIPVRELKADTDKFTRAIPAQVRCENGTAWFPADAPWLEEWEHELLSFPNGTHDDQVDVFAYAARELAYGKGMGWKRPKLEPETPQERIRAQLDRQRRRDREHPVLGSL